MVGVDGDRVDEGTLVRGEGSVVVGGLAGADGIGGLCGLGVEVASDIVLGASNEATGALVGITVSWWLALRISTSM